MCVCVCVCVCVCLTGYERHAGTSHRGKSDGEDREVWAPWMNSTSQSIGLCLRLKADSPGVLSED